MFRFHALGGVSVAALQLALFAPMDAAHAQTADRTLPAVTVEAPREARVRAAAAKPRVRSSSAQRATRAPAATASSAPAQAGIVTASAAVAKLYEAPTGQTTTTLGRSLFENRPAFSVGDVLRDSPGVSVKQGNGPRDLGISIRGSNARNGFGIRNLVIFEDGFPVTQPDGLSRSDLIDPRAYAAIDVIRGPSSALYGNYATGGALNFRTRPGGTIDGIEYGVDGGSFGYLNNYLAAGKKAGNFEASLFASDARGDGFIGNSWFNTQTVNFLATLQATPDDRFTVKLINNDLSTRLPIRSSLNQFYQNPFQQGCATGATAAGCGTVPLFINGFNGPTTAQTAVQAGLGRNDRRTIVGGRWEHDFDNHDDMAQSVRIRRPRHQPADRGHHRDRRLPVVQFHERRHEARRNLRHGFHHLLRRLLQYDVRRRATPETSMPGGNATLGLLQSNVLSEHHELRRPRARRTQADARR